MLTDTKIAPVTLESLSTSVESLSVSLKAISQSIAKLPTREEMNAAIDGSIEEFARMVAAGFKETDALFYKMDKRFDGLENRFGGLEDRFDGLENRFGGLEDRFGGLEETVSQNYGFRLRKIESRLQMAWSVLYLSHEIQQDSPA